MWSDRCDAYRAALNDGPYLAGDRPTFASHWSASYQSTLASHRPAFASNRWTFASPTGRRSLREVLIVSSGCQVDRPDGHPYRPEIDQNANDLAFGHSSFLRLELLLLEWRSVHGRRKTLLVETFL